MKRFLIALYFSIPFFAVAQSNFQKGYLITSSRDTTYGYIDYKERGVNPKLFHFKTQLNAVVQTLTVENISACVIEGMDIYRSFPVDITTSSIELSNLSDGPDLRFRTDTVFLRVLQEGKNATLYAYKDQVKMRFYIKENDAEKPVELIRQLYMREGGIMATGDAYIRQMRALLQKFNPAQIGKYPAKLKYDQSDLMKIMALINDQELEKPRFAAIRFFAGAGINATKAKFTGNNLLANSNAVAKTSYLPAVNFGVDLFANPAIGKLIYRAEFSFVMSKNEISTTTTDRANAALSQTFNQYVFAVTPQLIYHIYNRDRFKIFIGAGIGMNISHYTNNIFKRYSSFRDETEIMVNETSLQQFYVSIPFAAGVVINKRIEVNIGYSLPAAITNYVAYSITSQRSHFGINYLFGRK